MEAEHGDHRVERVGVDVGHRCEVDEERVEVEARAIGDPKRGAVALEAFDGRAAGGSTGSEEDDVRIGEFASERFLHCGGEAIAVSVEATPAGGCAQKRVDGADRP